MAIDSIGIDLEPVLSLGRWLESEDTRTVQRRLEEQITKTLFSHDPTSPAFQMMATQLAWIGSRSEERAFLEKEILALNFPNGYSIEPCGLFKEIGKAGRAVGHFVADHVVEIAVGVTICATGVGIAIATGYALSASVGGVVVAGAGSVFHSEEKPNPHIPSVPLPGAYSQVELAVIQQDGSVTLPKIELPSSVDEVLVTADGVWAHDQFFSTDGLMKHSMFSSILQKPTPEETLELSIDSQRNDWKTLHIYPSRQQETIASNSIPYLERGIAHFDLGQYDRALEDYKQFTSQTQAQKPNSLSVSEFSLGFAKGLPKGVYESGEGLFLWMGDFVKHPIQTSKQIVDSVSTLVDLVRKDEWGVVAEALAPEVHQLVTQWDTLLSEKRGELAGYAVGKHGADILVPGALAKVASKSVKSAQELAVVCKNLQMAREALILETAAGIESSAKIAEIIEAGQKTACLADELGFSAREIGQLKQTGQLEITVAKHYEHLSLSMQESAMHKKAQDALKQFAKKPMPEFKVRELIHETGIPTFARPKSIPEDFLVMITDRGAGMEYIHPMNTHIRVRVMPGKPHSPNPSQQKPYVIQKIDGGALDKAGKRISPDAPEAHIPVEEFTYRGHIDGN